MIDSIALIALARGIVSLATTSAEAVPNFQQAGLRRAISTAYYALFHEIVEQASAFAFPGDHQSRRFSQ